MNNFLSKFTEEVRRNWLWLLLTFAAQLGAILFSTYLYRHVGTAPAVLFTAHGIALAAFIMLGYSAALPVALASMVSGFINGSPLLIVIPNILAAVAQPALALFFLNKLNFKRSLENTRDFMVFLGVTSLISTIAPTTSVVTRMAFNTYIGSTATFSWMHIWAGVLLSCVILTPFILRWTVPLRKRTIGDWIEIVSILSLFAITNYIASYTPNSVIYGVSIAIPYFLLLLWIALRAGSRFVTLAMLMTCVITFSGLFLGVHEPTAANMRPIPDRIYSTQILFIFMALFYYTLCAIEERRRAAVRELAKYTENLKSSLTEKEMNEEAKNEFIATLGHEIRNPLAAILSSVELMKVAKKDEAQRERLLESMEDRIRSMARLLDDIFDISRITQRKLKLKKEILRARTVLRSAVESVEAYMRKNGHQFTVTYPDKTVLIEADPVRIEQVVTNLLYNAAKYTPSGGLIDCKATYEGEHLVIRVRDTGVGLTEEEQEKIFEPFMQINPKQSLMGGVGLGLTLAKNLVEMHGGSIEVQSDGLGRGSEFIVRLPAKIGTPPVKIAPEPAPKPTAESSKILVVDDNVDAARGMGKLLELHGHETEVAYTGQEALDKARVLQPHGVILDIGLPDIDGYEVARRMREAGHASILIALSGYGHDDHKRKARDAGFDFFLTKPVSIAEVVKIMNVTPKEASKRQRLKAEAPGPNKQSRI